MIALRLVCLHSLRTTGRLSVDCVQAAEDARTRKRSDVIVAAAVALAAVVSVESPFIHVDSIQASSRSSQPQTHPAVLIHLMRNKGRRFQESNLLLSSSCRDSRVMFARADFLFSPGLGLLTSRDVTSGIL